MLIKTDLFDMKYTHSRADVRQLVLELLVEQDFNQDYRKHYHRHFSYLYVHIIYALYVHI